MTSELVALLLNLTLFGALIGVPFLMLAPARYAKTIALVASLVPFVLSVIVYVQFRAAGEVTPDSGYWFESSFRWFGQAGANGAWITDYDIKYITGVDGISIYLLLLSTLLFPLSIWFSAHSITTNEKAYYALLLLLEVGILGVFLSLDLVLFYIFFEVGLIPMYFLIGMWGGKDRIYAAVKFFLYTLFGSVLMLLSVLYLGSYVGEGLGTVRFTGDIVTIIDYLRSHPLPGDVQTWLFWGFAISFLIKVPVFPVHTWLPAAHVQAPTAGSVILAGLMLKMGTYGLVRFNLPLFPQASVESAWIMGLIGLIGVIYGAMAAMVQTDIKKLVAYSSVAHMGFIVMGIFAFTPEAMSGALLQNINHGISTGALFLIVGMIYDRRHSREIADFQGIAAILPVFTLMFMIATLSSIGLPGLNGFVGEFLILLGTFQSAYVPQWMTIIATTGVIIAAVYMLWMFRRVMFGALDKEENRQLTDLTRAEVAILLPLIALMFIIGFYATPFLQEIGRTSDPLVQSVLQAVSNTTALK
jgi:NADH-quinone oxidoreductase subunit M